MLTDTGKKKGSRKTVWNLSIMETRCAAVLNLLMEKDKEEFWPIITHLKLDKPVSPKKKDDKKKEQTIDTEKNMEDNTKDETENGHPFLTPIQRNTPSLENIF